MDGQGERRQKTLELLKKLRNKRIFLFGTAGFGGSEEYFQSILDRAKQSVDESCSVVGGYMCQGKMPASVKERYLKMKEQPNPPANIDMLIANFDSALSHPDAQDLDRLKKAVSK